MNCLSRVLFHTISFWISILWCWWICLSISSSIVKPISGDSFWYDQVGLEEYVGIDGCERSEGEREDVAVAVAVGGGGRGEEDEEGWFVEGVVEEVEVGMEVDWGNGDDCGSTKYYSKS